MLEVEGLRVSIKGFPILRGVTLKIQARGLIGLVGRNGAGKTTTMKGILGLVPVTGGRIALDGKDLSKVPAHKRAPLGIGYMPEDRRLIGALTVEDNILMPAWATGRTDDRHRQRRTSALDQPGGRGRLPRAGGPQDGPLRGHRPS